MALWEAFSAIETLVTDSRTPVTASETLVTASRTPVPASVTLVTASVTPVAISVTPVTDPGTPGREPLPPDISGIDRDTEIREYKAMFVLNDSKIEIFSHELVVNCAL